MVYTLTRVLWRSVIDAAIARRVGVSTRALETLFLKIVDASPGAYFVALRLNAARRLVLNTNLSIAEVAERSGFSAIASLSRAFRRQFGAPLSAARLRDSEGRPPTRVKAGSVHGY